MNYSCDDRLEDQSESFELNERENVEMNCCENWTVVMRSLIGQSNDERNLKKRTTIELNFSENGLLFMSYVLVFNREVIRLLDENQ